jgi:hypothetical protein
MVWAMRLGDSQHDFYLFAAQFRGWGIHSVISWGNVWFSFFLVIIFYSPALHASTCTHAAPSPLAQQAKSASTSLLTAAAASPSAFF